MDDKTQATFPEFRPQPSMFEDAPYTATDPATQTPPETGKPKRKYTRKQPTASPAKAEPARQRKGKPRGARRTMPTTTIREALTSSIAEMTPEQKRRSPRKAKQTRPLMVPIGFLPELGGMKSEDASLLMSLIGNLQTTNKRSRAKIVAALGKLFG